MKRTIIVAIVFAGVIATGYRAYLNEHGRHDAVEGRDVTSWTSDEARRDGVLISRLELEPGSLVHHGREFLFADAWIEKSAVHRFPLVWFRKRVPTDGFVVVIRPTSAAPRDLVLWPVQGSVSFAWRGGAVYSYYSKTEPSFPMVVTIHRGGSRVPVLTLRQPNQALQTTPVTRSEI